MRLEVVDRLLEEHRLIEAMAERLDAMLDPFDLERVAEAIGFFEGYVERIHLAKELRVVEHMLSRRPNECREVARWVVAEQQALLRALAEARRAFERLEAGDPSGADHCRERLLAYRERLLDLLIDEDAWLYPLVDRLLAGQEGAASASLQRIEERAGGRAVVDRFERMAVPRRSSTLVVAPRKKPRKGPPASIDARTLAVGEGDSMDLVCTNLHDSAEHTVRRMSERGEGLAIEANQFLLVNGEEGIILDPGGPKVYPRLLVETRATLARRELRYVFLSHQDPDVVTSLNAWLVDTDADVYTSRLWHRFVPHFSVDRLLEGRLKPIPDGGMRLPLGGIELLILPAHFLHSCGNFQVYDPVSKTLFSGDLGASVDYARERATSLAELVPYMAGFHRRYMASRRAMAAWAKMARRLDIARMAPQHGAVLEGRAIVQDFIDWCEQLECGIDLLEDIFTIPE